MDVAGFVHGQFDGDVPVDRAVRRMHWQAADGDRSAVAGDGCILQGRLRGTGAAREEGRSTGERRWHTTADYRVG
jgi:hypothetical protein